MPTVRCLKTGVPTGRCERREPLIAEPMVENQLAMLREALEIHRVGIADRRRLGEPLWSAVEVELHHIETWRRGSHAEVAEGAKPVRRIRGIEYAIRRGAEVHVIEGRIGDTGIVRECRIQCPSLRVVRTCHQVLERAHLTGRETAWHLRTAAGEHRGVEATG